MKTLSAVVLMSVFFLAPMTLRAEEAVENAAETVAEVGNKICPVSNEKVGEMGPAIKIEHNKKIYNLCCGMCARDFKNDPEKYIKIAEDEVAAEQKQ